MKIGIILCVLLAAIPMTYGKMRTWTSKKGQTLKAEYVNSTAGKVILKSAGGKEKKIPITGLCQADQDYIYLKTPPKLKIKFDTNEKSSEVDGYKRVSKVKCEVTIIKSDARPYPGELKVYFFVVGWVSDRDNYILLDRKEETFKIEAKSGSEHRVHGKLVQVEHSTYSKWGVKYEDYLVCIKTSDGRIVATEGKSLFQKKMNNLMKAKEKELLDRNLKSMGTKYSNYIY